MKYLLVILLLSACAHQPAPTGYECDPSGACWPLDMKAPVRPFVVVYEPIKTIRTGHAAYKGSRSSAYGYIELYKRPVVIHIADDLPYSALRCGWSQDLILRHELGHLNGVTVHDMLAKRNC